MMDLEAQTSLQPSLLRGERILWAGRPQRGIVFRRDDLYMVPFSLLWGGFVINWNFGVWSDGAPIFFAIWGIPFLLVGIYLVVGRFFHDAFVRGHLLYAVTNQRLLFLRTGPWGQFRSLEIGYLPVLELEQQHVGRGTIKFDINDDHGPWRGRGFGSAVPALSRALRFDLIDHPAVVYDLIRQETERWRKQQYGSV